MREVSDELSLLFRISLLSPLFGFRFARTPWAAWGLENNPSHPQIVTLVHN